MGRIVGNRKIINDIAGIAPYASRGNVLSGIIVPIVQMFTGIEPFVKHTHVELSKYGKPRFLSTGGSYRAFDFRN